MLVGDFNCVIEPIDVELNFNDKFSQDLHNFCNELLYTDAYRTLHPNVKQFSFFRRGATASRLDRIYLPPLLGATPT